MGLKGLNLDFFNETVYKETGYKVLGSFLFGSQNYGLDTEDSDVDVITVVIPSLEYIVTHKDFITKKFDKKDGGKVLVYDIRKYVDLLLKMDANALECYYTPYAKLSSSWDEYFKFFMEDNYLHTNLLFYKPKVFANSTLGRAKSYLLLAEKARLRDNKKVFCKKIAMGQYCLDVLDKYYSNDFQDYSDLIKGAKDILDIKTGKSYFSKPFDYYDWEAMFKTQLSISAFETDVSYKEQPAIRDIIIDYTEQILQSYFVTI